jgi:hypothetical protein
MMRSALIIWLTSVGAVGLFAISVGTMEPGTG